MLSIEQAVSAEDFQQVQLLLAEYFEFLRTEVDKDLDDLDSVPTTAGYQQELSELPGRYAPPDGRLLLARYAQATAGCIAFYKYDEGICEVKRLWVRPEYRGKKVGRALVERLVAEARQCGYREMLLSTVDVLTEAHTLYRSLGFEPTEPFFTLPPGMMEHEVFLKLRLEA